MAVSSHLEDDPRHELMSALSTLHLSGRFSDLKIVCNERQWAVHKAIVCSRSGFFDGACSNTFRESDSGVIDLSEDDEDAVDQMIHYFYYLDYMNQNERRPSPVFRHRALSNARRQLSKKLDLSQIEDPLLAQAGFTAESTRPTTPPQYSLKLNTDVLPAKKALRSPKSKYRRSLTPPPRVQDIAVGDLSSSDEEEDEDCENEDEADNSKLLLHTRVYALAEKFDVPGLKQVAKSKFEVAMACYYDSPELAEAIEEVYNSTVDSDRGLRDVVLQAFRSHPQLANTQDVFSVIKTTPTLAFELFKIERGIPI